jgi:hypothetical protein
MASFGVNPVSPEASKSWFLRKICPSSTGSKSTSHNHCAEVLVTAALFEIGKVLIGLYIGKQALESTHGAASSIAISSSSAISSTSTYQDLGLPSLPSLQR